MDLSPRWGKPGPENTEDGILLGKRGQQFAQQQTACKFSRDLLSKKLKTAYTGQEDTRPLAEDLEHTWWIV